MVSILNPAAIDALCSAAYLEHYLDCVDELPVDLQRYVSVLRELDCLANDALADVKRHYEIWQVGDGMSDSTVLLSEKRRLAVTQLQRSLGRMQEIGDQKLATVAEIIEQVESKARQLEQNVDNLTNVGVIKEEETGTSNVTLPVQNRQVACAVGGNTSNIAGVLESTSVSASPAPGKPIKIEEKPDIAVAVKTGKRQKRTRNMQDAAPFDKEDKKNEDEDKVSLRKKKVKKERGDNHSPVNSKLNIDPNEPTYCLCQQVSYGEMIGCDNEHCPIEWFHFDCVRLTHKPKGKWYCPRCRGARPNIINPELLTEQGKRVDKTACGK